MTTYVYETIPTKPGEEVRYFEIQQSMTESALARHPDTGEPIRRVILGGYGLVKKEDDAPSAGGCCGDNGCCD
jgi:predicted nucleic acid-binding Zn ribbon protein